MSSIPSLASLPALLRRGAILALALLLAGCGKIDLYNNLDEKEANEMIAALERQGIGVGKEPGEEGKFKIMVENGRFADAVAVLKSQGYPRDRFADMGEMFKKSGLVSSPTEERIRFMHALADSLSETITHVDGVLHARVHIVLPDNDPFAERARPSSAAVFIKHRPNADVESFVPQIKNLVVNSIEGLAYEKVSVAAVPAEEPATSRGAAASSEHVRLFGVEVARSSIPQFWLLVGGLVVLGAGGIGAAAWSILRGSPGGRAARVEALPATK